jgi:thiamine biosynthesis lipoprotein
VLKHACVIAAITEGAFDVSVAPALVARGLLPRPESIALPTGDWRDIEFLPHHQIRFRKPLWIDLGGIAKGYAVDRAVDRLRAFAPAQACVNAGGDLRIIGEEAECVRLASDIGMGDDLPVMEIRDGSLASSCGVISGRRCADIGPHIDARDNRAAHPMQFVSVAAPRCMDADALTKVVMARGACCAKILAQFGAQAVVHDAQFGWREIRGHA